jgi:hypothetical protein
MPDTIRWLFERKSGQVYGTYISSFFLVNWPFFYVLLFSSPQAGGQRISDAYGEFLNRFDILGYTFGLTWMPQFIIPTIATYIFIVWVPYLNNWAYEVFLKHQEEREVEKSEKDKRVAERIASAKTDERKSLQTVEEESEEIENIKSRIPSSSRWDAQFNDFYTKDKEAFKEKLNSISYLVLRKNGNKLMYPKPVEFGILNDLLNDHGDRVSLTEKGTYFVNMLRKQP